MSPDLAERLSANREQFYRALKSADFELYRRCIQGAEAITLNHNLPNKVAVEIEVAVVFAACDALRLKP